MGPVFVKALRIGVVILTLAGAWVAVGWRADAAKCREVRQRVFSQGLIDKPPTADQVSILIDRCDDPEQLAIAAVGLARASRPEAVQLARVARNRAPETFAPWAALTFALANTDVAEARRTWAVAKRLNPRWDVPEPAAAP